MKEDYLRQLATMLEQVPVISPISLEFPLVMKDGHHLTAESGERLIGVSNRDISQMYTQPYYQAKKHLDRFLTNQPNNRWLLMPGLRGTGKTTILKQLYHHVDLNQITKFYLSLDQVKLLNADFRMIDVIQALETVLQSRLEDYTDPIIFLLDEVQYLSNWALGLKVLFDRCPRVFILSTGSSAIALQTNPDVARRVDIVKIHPLSFPDFVNLKQAYSTGLSKLPPNELKENLQDALLKSTSAQQSMARLEDLRPFVRKYWQNLNRSQLLNQYRQYGTLPYVLSLANEAEQSHRVNQTLNTILLKDLAVDSRSSAQTLANMPKLLLMLAHAEKRGLASLAKMLGLSLTTVQDMIYQLEQAEIIQAVKPWGAKSGHLTKPYRYLFSSPAIRLALVDSGGRIHIDNTIRDRVRGLLWEDVVGLYLKRILNHNWQSVIEYDTAPGGADFIISSGDKNSSIVIEVGSRKTTSRQVIQTRRLADSRYGLIITDSSLKLDEKHKTIYLPFEFFLLT